MHGSAGVMDFYMSLSGRSQESLYVTPLGVKYLNMQDYCRSQVSLYA